MPTVTLTWDDINDNEDGFHIYRDTAPLDTANPENLPAPLATVAAGIGAYDDTTAAADTTYYYAVAAVKGTFINPADEIQVQVSAALSDPIGFEVGDNAAYTLSNDNRTAENITGSWEVISASPDSDFTTGKRYFELHIDDRRSSMGVGMEFYRDGWASLVGNSVHYSSLASGRIYEAGTYSEVENYGTGDVIGVAVDYDSKNVDFYKNGVLIGSGSIPEQQNSPAVAMLSYDATATVALNKRFLQYPAPPNYLAYDE